MIAWKIYIFFQRRLYLNFKGVGCVVCGHFFNFEVKSCQKLPQGVALPDIRIYLINLI